MMGNHGMARVKLPDGPKFTRENLVRGLSFTSGLQTTRWIHDRAGWLLDAYYGGKPVSWPVPVRGIAAACGLEVYEHRMADQAAMEFTDYGGGSTCSNIELVETGPNVDAVIVGKIEIEESMGEYWKRFLIARELGRTMLREKPVGTVFTGRPYMGPFSLESAEDIAVDEFAFALLLPHDLVSVEKEVYETRNKSNPVSHMAWIRYLADMAKVPEYAAMMGYESFKRCDAAVRALIPEVKR